MPITDIFSGGMKGLAGLYQLSKANKWLNNNPMPVESMPRELLENKGIANNMANIGMPQEQYNNAMTNIQRQQMMAIKSAQDRRGGLAALAGITNATNTAVVNLDSADAQARTQNQRTLLGVNTDVARTRRDLYDKNVRDPYNRDFDYNMRLKGQGLQNLYRGAEGIMAGTIGGINDLASYYTGGMAGGGNRRSSGQTTVGYDPAWDNYGQPG